ncbi:hypothetical protein [Nocardia callitridis]|uniref:Potassium/proton antiporter subunit KhtT-like N-terminal domain-containing protein n=1 Tax=Nocardia callitridis TaxID=648753 RepID=A0ABP9KLK4_9NOCA
MEINRTTVPGTAEVHHLLARGGARLAVVTARDGDKQILVYDRGHDEPSRTIVLEQDEADQLAQILHSAPMSDRVARLERRVHQLAGEGSR